MKKKTFTILFYVKRTKLLKNGEAPIFMRITVDAVRNKLLNFDYYDVVLDDKVFSSMSITIGPGCSSADKIIIESLLKDLNPQVTFGDSFLKDKIRL